LNYITLALDFVLCRYENKLSSIPDVYWLSCLYLTTWRCAGTSSCISNVCSIFILDVIDGVKAHTKLTFMKLNTWCKHSLTFSVYGFPPGDPSLQLQGLHFRPNHKHFFSTWKFVFCLAIFILDTRILFFGCFCDRKWIWLFGSVVTKINLQNLCVI
jgi:hypothetical protein